MRTIVVAVVGWWTALLFVVLFGVTQVQLRQANARFDRAVTAGEQSVVDHQRTLTNLEACLALQEQR